MFTAAFFAFQKDGDALNFTPKDTLTRSEA